MDATAHARHASSGTHSTLVTGWRAALIRLRVKLYILRTAARVYRNPLRALRTLRRLIEERRRVQGTRLVRKYALVDGRYYWSNVHPGFPSRKFARFIESEMNRATPFRADPGHLNTIIFSVTSRCPLRCEHCYDHENLASEEVLPYKELEKIVTVFREYGIDQFQLSGGEPLSRFDDTVSLIESASADADFWLLTSGFGLTLEKARRLKAAGLIGVNISLDHWEERKHNAFRGHDQSFDWVRQAAENSRAADLVVCFSLCATREFVTAENLERYLQLAHDWGASFVRVLEPRRVGGFAGKDVELGEREIGLLLAFYNRANQDPTYRDMPIIMYPGYHQRRGGCFGAGDRYLYVDARADVHACPFCQTVVGNILSDPLGDVIERLHERGCHAFEPAVPRRSGAGGSV